ncbi:hypothetical protein HRE53_26995 (plasmid) [Acaryochloris sp. 'Moss Beach']|uniref:hypothetical protein n=1 Tax=Acaryochloris sp. 'Moss Beach' TaxID=2740837 RepID=UPI001F163A8A|nr:hypothetical protein [Acaryochloris sp. 'Moss Beach']UJB72260.1 hypothetical protein HRE53_26995 [Acaryochloris sp. 'Moss Beach']
MTNYSESQAPQPSNTPQGNPNLLTSESLAQISQDLKRSVQNDLTGVQIETERLRSRSNFIIGMLIAFVMILGGVSVWLAIRVLSFEQEPQTSNINADLSETVLESKIEALEQDVKSLKKFDPSALTEEVQNNQEQLQKVVQQVKRLSTDIQSLNGSNGSSDIRSRQSNPAPEVQSQPSSSEPQPSAQPRVSP